MLSRQTIVRSDTNRRYHLGIEGELIKRGRNKGLFGWFRGRPWASRNITLECTYTNSVLRTWKEDEKRDTIDLLGCSAKECDPASVKGRPFCIAITFQWGEVFILQVDKNVHNGDLAEVENERKRWIDALNAAGKRPTQVDVAAEKMKLHVLSFQHESVVYEYMQFRQQNDKSLSDILRATGAFTNEDGQRDSQIAAGRRLHSSRPESELLAEVNKWIEKLEKTFPGLYRSSSDEAELEEFHKAELERNMATHEHEKADTMASHGDEGMINSRYFTKVLTDRASYAKAKEERFFSQVSDLVDQFMINRR